MLREWVLRVGVWAGAVALGVVLWNSIGSFLVRSEPVVEVHQSILDLPVVEVADSYKEFLRQEFFAVQKCTGIFDGRLSDVRVLLLSEKAIGAACSRGAIGCFSRQGQLDTPTYSRIYLTGVDNSPTNTTWRHELVHYFLWVETGDPDGDHTSLFFTTCTDPTFAPSEKSLLEGMRE